MSELLIHQYDDEVFVIIETYEDAAALSVLRQMQAENAGDNRYRLPVDKLGEFCDRRFGIERPGHRRSSITESQREARRRNMAAVRAKRWRQEP